MQVLENRKEGRGRNLGKGVDIAKELMGKLNRKNNEGGKEDEGKIMGRKKKWQMAAVCFYGGA